MGLFRRGTKLLKLGSGLRDCCCRPEQPEECWCPDFCTYYWQWDGGKRLGLAATLLESQCGGENTGSFGYEADFGLAYTDDQPFGLIAVPSPPLFSFGQYESYTDAFDDQNDTSIDYFFKFRLSRTISGDPTPKNYQIIATHINIPSYRTFYLIHLESVEVGVSCRTFPAFGIRVGVRRSVWLHCSDVGYSLSWGTLVNYTEESAGIVSSECIKAPELLCPGRNSNFGRGDYPNAHLPQEDALISWDNTRAYYKGIELSQWQYITPYRGGLYFGRPYQQVLPDSLPEALSGWNAGGLVPLQSQVTLKRKRFCAAGPCYCTESLTGMTVTFEGKTFTYGSLEQFVDGSDTWEETIPGLFRRTTRETCDGTYVAAVKIAEVFCETVDGTDYWTVYLDSECYERDEATCPASPDARRIMQWTGVFTCGEDGKPGGTPHSATDAADPPDLDSNTTLGTPAAECAGDLDLPAISFG